MARKQTLPYCTDWTFFVTAAKAEENSVLSPAIVLAFWCFSSCGFPFVNAHCTDRTFFVTAAKAKENSVLSLATVLVEMGNNCPPVLNLLDIFSLVFCSTGLKNIIKYGTV